MELEYSLIKAPFERLNGVFRNSQKNIEKELSLILTSIQDLEKKKDKGITKEEAAQSLEKLTTKLQGLKRKIEETKKEEEKQIQRCKVRLGHLESSIDLDFKKTKNSDTARWNQSRLNRIVGDYLARNGYYESLQLLSTENGMKDLLDIDIFLSAKKVLDSLQSKECKEALKWCNENRSRLKKSESTLEFNLRLQEFIELVRLGKQLDAITYMRKNLSSYASTNLKEIQLVSTILVLPKDTQIPRYKEFFSVERWNKLAEEFKKDNYMLHSLPPHSLMEINLQSGLSVLKTTACMEENGSNINCPVCNVILKEIALPLPFSHHVLSSLVCRITGKVMNEDNPPLILPNGHAYSKQALEEMALRNDGIVVCPRTNEQYKFEQLRKAFIS